MPRAFNDIFQMDPARLLKYINSGIVMAVLGLAIIIVSNTIRAGVPSLFTAINNENMLNFWSNFIGYAEYVERSTQSTQAQYWIVAACYFIKAAGQIALLFGLVFAMLGFFGTAFNYNNEDKTRLVCLIAGCVLIFVTFMGMIAI